MRVVSFDRQLREVAVLYDRPHSEVRQAATESAGWLPRWLAVDGSAILAGARVAVRPDGRAFLSVRGDPSAIPVLARTIGAQLGVALHMMAAEMDFGTVEEAKSAGFEVEIAVERFLVRFDDALAMVRRAFTPLGIRIVGVTDLHEDDAFRLDNEVRQDVPGTDGWVGDRSRFHAEIHDDEAFDPSAYLVALDERGAPQGLIRFWRNPDRPRLGLVGVRRSHRGGVLAGALLKEGLQAASAWGSDVFSTEASLSNRAVHPRLCRLACAREGVSLQLVRPAPSTPVR